MDGHVTTNPMPGLTSTAIVDEGETAAQRAWRQGTGLAAVLLLAILSVLAFTRSPDWSTSTGVNAPLTRTLLYFHPPAAWASFVAYAFVFGASIAYLNEREPRHDRAARAAAEVGWVLNTIALATGTFWGIQEWTDSERSALATVYSEPKVLVVVVLWATFGAYLVLRRLVPGQARSARMGAAFAILGFLAVPASFVTSRLLTTSLHPDIAGPGANPDAAVSTTIGWLLVLGFTAFVTLFVALFLTRLHLARLEERVEDLEAI